MQVSAATHFFVWKKFTIYSHDGVWDESRRDPALDWKIIEPHD